MIRGQDANIQSLRGSCQEVLFHNIVQIYFYKQIV